MDNRQKLSIDALTVEVKAIRVGKKHMTQAVFRQLPQKSIVDYGTGEIRGTPWCYVNYFWGDCKDDHCHLVWQEGDIIYRDCFYPYETEIGFSDKRRNLKNEYSKKLYSYRKGLLCLALVRWNTDIKFILKEFNDREGCLESEDLPGFEVHVNLGDRALSLLKKVRHYRDTYNKEEEAGVTHTKEWFFKEVKSVDTYIRAFIEEYETIPELRNISSFDNHAEYLSILHNCCDKAKRQMDKSRDDLDFFDEKFRSSYNKIISRLEQFYISV